MDTAGSRAGEVQMYSALMRKQANNNKYVPTSPAPKRLALKMFGGTLSIEEFRASTSNVFVTMPWETHIIPIVNLASNKLTRSLPVDGPKDDLVLRRTKPLARAKSSLEASLGITRKTR
jgi:hypothetical protein